MPSAYLLIAATAVATISAQSFPQPVLTLPYTPNIMDATLKHFCLWSRTNSINISYSEFRRNDEVCAGCCGTTDSTYVNSRSCHQSPFAKSYESAAFGAGCVSAYENAFLGWWLGQWFREIKGGRNTAFGERLPILVNVEGLDCTSVREGDVVGANVEVDPVAICGADNPGRTLASGVERRVIPPSVAQNTYNSSYSLVIVPLGDLAPGRYTLDAKITGKPFDIRLWDNVGDDLVVGVITPNEQNQISLNFEGPRIGVGLMLATPDENAEIAWVFRGGNGGGGGGDGGGTLTTRTLPVPSASTTNLISYFPPSSGKSFTVSDHDYHPIYTHVHQSSNSDIFTSRIHSITSTAANHSSLGAAEATGSLGNQGGGHGIQIAGQGSQQTAVPSGSGTARPSGQAVLSNDAGAPVVGPIGWPAALSGLGAGLMVFALRMFW